MQMQVFMGADKNSAHWIYSAGFEIFFLFDNV